MFARHSTKLGQKPRRNGAKNEKIWKRSSKVKNPDFDHQFSVAHSVFFGYVGTRVNYDILSYLPKDIETMVGQDILVDEFGTGAFSMFMVEGMKPKETAALKAQIEKTEHVEKVIWYDSVMDISVPMELMPDELYEAFNSGDCTLMIIIFNETTSADSTMEAIEEIRRTADKNCFLSGMSAVVTDTKNLSEKEAPVYVFIAVLLTCIVLSLAMDSYLVSFIFWSA